MSAPYPTQARSNVVPGSLVMPLILLAVWLFFAALNPQFLSPRNLTMLMIELSVTATLAVGMLLIILPGHIDLSAGSGVGFLGGTAAVLTTNTVVGAPIAMLLSFLLGILLWSLMGLAIVRLRIQAFIVTLGGLLVFKGLFWLVISSSTVAVVGTEQANLYSSLTTTYVSPSWGWWLWLIVTLILCWQRFRERAARRQAGMNVDTLELCTLKLLTISQALLLVVLAANLYRGVPICFLILTSLAVIIDGLTRQTPFGRYLYAIGGNEEASAACGVPVRKTVIVAFSIMGAIVAITGFMQTSYAGASTTTVGDLMELDAIAACVIGGASLKGGRGTVLGTIVGALIMASLLNGMTLLAIAPEFKLIVRGTVLVLAVVMDVRLRGAET